MKPLITTFSFLSLASLGLAGDFITLDGASGSQSHDWQINTDNNLTIDLGFKVEYLLVGGGGGGGGSINNADVAGAGGGGAGGLVSGDAFLFASAFDVEVGAGGASGLNAATASVLQQGGNGGTSRLAGLEAVGGGGGGRFKVVGNNGGSGGGGGGRGTGNNLTTAGGLGTELQGNAGGSSRDDDSTGRAAGGGGAGGVGGNGGIDVSIAGNGGVGLANWITGSAVHYAGGGGGGAADIWATGGAAGAGGAGGGATGTVSGNAFWGVNGLGGGGGGSGLNGDGGRGGSGVVIVRYKGTAAGTGGAITAGTGYATGYTLHTFTTVGQSNLDLSSIDFNSRLGVVQDGVISGSGSLNFSGPGTLTLTATNTLTGAISVNAGTLAIANSGSIAQAAGVRVSDDARFNVSTVDGGYTLGSNQYLTGGGTVTGNVTVAGTHRLEGGSGADEGLVQAFDDRLSYTGGSTILWSLYDDTRVGRGAKFGGVDVVGDLSFDVGTTLMLDFVIVADHFVNFGDSFWDSDIQGKNGWKIFGTTGAVSGLENLQIDQGNFSEARSSASFSLFEADDGIYLNYSAVPEPSATLLGGLGALFLLRRRR
jgi:hypothetical protein